MFLNIDQEEIYGSSDQQGHGILKFSYFHVVETFGAATGYKGLSPQVGLVEGSPLEMINQHFEPHILACYSQECHSLD